MFFLFGVLPPARISLQFGVKPVFPWDCGPLLVSTGVIIGSGCLFFRSAGSYIWVIFTGLWLGFIGATVWYWISRRIPGGQVFFKLIFLFPCYRGLCFSKYMIMTNEHKNFLSLLSFPLFLCIEYQYSTVYP